MNYKKIKDDYVANEGYLFENKHNGYTCRIMSLPESDSIDNYNIIEEPIIQEVIEEEIIENTES